MMNEDWTEGFKAGFKIGLEEGKRNQNLNPVPYTQPYVPLSLMKDKCPKCGITISGVMNYTCSSINCPTFYQATSSVGKPLTGAVGAVGSMNANYESSAPGTNGPSGPIDYSMR
jgi:hypothetical protein